MASYHPVGQTDASDAPGTPGTPGTPGSPGTPGHASRFTETFRDAPSSPPSNSRSLPQRSPPATADPETDLGRGLMAEYQNDDALLSASPSAPFMRASGSRPMSLASSHMLGGGGSDYDSVHKLWRNSGMEPSASAQGSYADRRVSSGGSGAFEKYYDDAPPGKHGEALGMATLGAGAVGAAGRRGKDYNNVSTFNKIAGERGSGKRKAFIIGVTAAVVLILVVAIVVPIVAVLLKDDDKNNSNNANSGDSGNSGNSGSGGGDGKGKSSPKVLVTGGNGSTIDLGNGKSFTYLNNFGGFWVSIPLNNSAQAQNYTKPLSEEWDYANDRILGVNLGGWLVPEPFIAPALFEPYENTSSPAVDEFTLSQKWLQEGGADNLKTKMTQHYDTFITERDFASIAAAGLNWVRLPIGFWALETYSDEPFLEGVSWNYFLKAIEWARKYGLRILLDLHAAPGSQNGYNHSGKLGTINWLQGPMGYANAQRTLNYIRTITEFISQPEIRNVVPAFGILNEAWLITIGQPNAQGFYAEVYQMMRNITGTGQGNGPYMVIHDGFIGQSQWDGFMAGSDRMGLDVHPYICFTNPNNDPWNAQILKPCNQFAPNMDHALANFGIGMGGEFSLAPNDCGLFVNGVGVGIRYDGTYGQEFTTKYGDCKQWDDWENYSDSTKTNLHRFATVQMDSLRNFFFWTWKIGNSLRTKGPINPFWSYSLGLQQGWMPKDPHAEAPNACQSEASRQSTTVAATTSWSTSFSAWQTGKASTYSPNVGKYMDNWPPTSMASISTPMSNLPSYTQTAAILTAPAPTLSVSVQGDPTPSVGAWFAPGDDAPMYTPIQGCSYPSQAYNMSGYTPNFPCSGRNSKRAPAAKPEPASAPRPTPAPAARRSRVARDS